MSCQESVNFCLGLEFAVKAPSQRQVGVIVHGGGVDTDYAILEAQTDGFATKDCGGYTELYRIPRTLE